MSSGLFSIGTSALSAAYTALRTASNNVANVNTPGYTRQITVLQPEVGSYISGNYLGQGVSVADVRRVYSEFLTQQAHQAQAQASGASMRHQQLAQVTNLFADPTTGIGTAIDSFFSGIGRTRVIMVAAALSMIVNVGANYVLIFGKLGVPAMGIRGAAYGTLIGSLAGPRSHG